MRYNVVLKDEVSEEKKWTFDNWQEAEIEAQFICRQHEDWVPDRYPGRSSRAGEVAVFLDRRVMLRNAPFRELAIVRTSATRPAPAKRAAQGRCKSHEASRLASGEGRTLRRRAAMMRLSIVRGSMTVSFRSRPRG